MPDVRVGHPGGAHGDVGAHEEADRGEGRAEARRSLERPARQMLAADERAERDRGVGVRDHDRRAIGLAVLADDALNAPVFDVDPLDRAVSLEHASEARDPVREDIPKCPGTADREVRAAQVMIEHAHRDQRR